MLDKADGDIPFLALAVLGTGRFFNDNLLLLAIIAGITALIGATWYSQPRGKTRRGRKLLLRRGLAEVPFFHDMAQNPLLAGPVSG